MNQKKGEKDFEPLLKKYGLKNTEGRNRILEVLHNNDQPQSVEDIVKCLGKKTPDIVTVYRTLETLKNKKLLNEVTFKDGLSRFEIVSSNGEHCHHAVCTSCGVAEHIHDEKLEKALDTVSSHLKLFKNINEHSLEFFGVCKKCVILHKHA
jgi:Fur family ferric uptake transcriptional regulator